ncbi:lysine exporter LysO family protein [Thorsellia anophelis]|uniref:Uncharacterized membrane protein YbjE, DUF340 family n=1 Tax=Thorsellia anophelis DSM 18579 TaxID=1123402 RepID=A0A1H9Z6T5_9GAMM|nr:lysine exporter LysO family protein [Thorsellia anophelis]SES77238.1 Uncharacterized membrane protein YbjE, DUF340 family [Thorsellia anophelis DSM 18579]
MLLNFLVILLPLMAGYLIVIDKFTHASQINKFINQFLNYMVFVILFCMGVNLAFLEDLVTNLKRIALYSGTFFFFICLANLLILMLLSWITPWRDSKIKGHGKINWLMLKGSLELIGCVIAGFIIGVSFNDTKVEPLLNYALDISQYALSILIFLVGIQLRHSGLTIKQILLNKKGLLLSGLILTSSLLAGMLAALILGMDMKLGLALSSGFGWYSLSGILISDAYGPLWGSIAFFNDLAREILVIILIPIFTAQYRYITLGLSGATSMDFTLPILQKNGGIEIVPAAIVQGFILSLAALLLLAAFS